MSDETYNGWTNYPTWCANLWMTNESGDMENTYDVVRANRDEGLGAVAVALGEWFEEVWLPDLATTVAADLLGWATANINWREIAESWMEQLAEDEAYARGDRV